MRNGSADAAAVSQSLLLLDLPFVIVVSVYFNVRLLPLVVLELIVAI
jgi:hypothetical protein